VQRPEVGSGGILPVTDEEESELFMLKIVPANLARGPAEYELS